MSGGWSESEWLQWTNGRGDFGFVPPHNVHNLRKTPDTTGSPAPSSTPPSTRAKVSATPRQSSLHWATWPQLQQREQLVIPLVFFIHSHCVLFMHFLCICKVYLLKSNNCFHFCLFFFWPQLSRSKPVIWSPRWRTATTSHPVRTEHVVLKEYCRLFTA